MYTTHTPNMNFKLQLEVVEPEFMYFLAYSAQFLRWFIKETLSKRLCESVNFEQKITEKHTPIFFGPSGRIDSVFQFCPPESMKFKHAQCWGHPPRANIRTWWRLGAIFGRKMSLYQGFCYIPYWDQSYRKSFPHWQQSTPVRVVSLSEGSVRQLTQSHLISYPATSPNFRTRETHWGI